MATMKDIAALTGVSHGTVSNVLNKKGNVSVEKMNLVENAARELGFKLNVQAKQLRQGYTKRVGIVVPQINQKSCCDLFEGLNEVLNAEGYEVDIYDSNHAVHYEEELLERIISSNPTAVIVVSSILFNTGMFNHDTKIIFVERYIENMPEHAVFVSFDFERAGAEIARACTEEGFKSVAVFCGNIKYSNHKQFLSGVKGILEKCNCFYKVFSSEDNMGFHVAFDIAASKYNFDAVITTSIENAEYLRNVQQYNLSEKPPVIYCLASKGIGPGSDVIKYELNYKLCGRRIAKYIVKTEVGELLPKDYLKLKNDGFYYPLKKKVILAEGQTINFLVLKSPTSHALKLLLPSFTMSSGINVRVVETSYSELYTSASDCEYSRAYDLIRLDMVWLSELGPKLFMPMDLNSEEISRIKDKLSSSLPDEYYKVGDIAYSLPFDSSVQILYYRKDLFEDALLKRAFYEKYKRQLTVPENFEEYNQVAEFFTKKYNPDSPTDYGTSLVFGSTIVASCDYLPRLKAAGASIFDLSGRVEINTPVVKETLQKYVSANAYTDQVTNMWWNSAMSTFAEGNAAMNIVFSNHASFMLNDIDSQVVGKIGFAAVPGGHPMLGGGVIGISKNSRNRKECLEFLNWLYDEKAACMITRLGGYINSKSLLDNIDILQLYPWIEGMEKAFGIGWRREKDKRNSAFDEYKFEEILGFAIRAAAAGIMNIDDALEEAQKKCDIFFN